MTCRSELSALLRRAHQILDRVRDGEPVSRKVIRWALRQTGDVT